MVWALLEVGLLLLLVAWIVWMLRPPKKASKDKKTDKNSQKGDFK